MTLQGVARRADASTATWYVGHLFSHLADSNDTGGSIAVMEVEVRKGLEPPPHTHTNEDEMYYILRGRWDVWCGENSFTAEPGAFVFLPRGVEHGFTVDADGAKALLLCVPGGLEAAFRAMSEPAAAVELPPLPTARPAMDRFLTEFGSRGIHFSPSRV
jgi:quercetin dioxygenase-like cupin family protein